MSFELVIGYRYNRNSGLILKIIRGKSIKEIRIFKAMSAFDMMNHAGPLDLFQFGHCILTRIRQIGVNKHGDSLASDKAMLISLEMILAVLDVKEIFDTCDNASRRLDFQGRCGGTVIVSKIGDKQVPKHPCSSLVVLFGFEFLGVENGEMKEFADGCCS